jgi:predicted nucleic acid-binding protein
VVAFLDRDHRLHGAADASIRKLIVGHRFYASVITFAEVLTGVRLGHHDEDLVRGFFDDLIVELLPVEHTTAETAARLRGDQKSLLRMPDALILAAADGHPEVEAVLTGDTRFKSVRGLSCRVSLLR